MPNKPTFLPILDDLPTGEDALDFAPYVDALADILLDADTHTPLTLGVFGSWGSGKTSLMTMLCDRVEGNAAAGAEPLPRTVWFNAWKYNQEDALWCALLLLLDDLENLLAENPPEALEGEPPPEKLFDMLRRGALSRDRVEREGRAKHQLDAGAHRRRWAGLQLDPVRIRTGFGGRWGGGGYTGSSAQEIRKRRTRDSGGQTGSGVSSTSGRKVRRRRPGTQTSACYTDSIPRLRSLRWIWPVAKARRRRPEQFRRGLPSRSLSRSRSGGSGRTGAAGLVRVTVLG